MKKRNIIGLIMGACALLGGVTLNFGQQSDTIASITLVNAGLVMIIMSLVRHFRYKKGPEQDERTRKVAFTALAASFQLTIMGLMIFWWVDYFYPINLSLHDFIAIVFLYMAALVILMRFYYAKRDVIV